MLIRIREKPRNQKVIDTSRPPKPQKPKIPLQVQLKRFSKRIPTAEEYADLMSRGQRCDMELMANSSGRVADKVLDFSGPLSHGFSIGNKINRKGKIVGNAESADIFTCIAIVTFKERNRNPYKRESTSGKTVNRAYFIKSQ